MFGGFVDPGCIGQVEDLWGVVGAEALGMDSPDGGQDLGAVGGLGGCQAVVDIGGGVQADPEVVVLVVTSVSSPRPQRIVPSPHDTVEKSLIQGQAHSRVAFCHTNPSR